jgi:hypothetical protein
MNIDKFVSKIDHSKDINDIRRPSISALNAVTNFIYLFLETIFFFGVIILSPHELPCDYHLPP